MGPWAFSARDYMKGLFDICMKISSPKVTIRIEILNKKCIFRHILKIHFFIFSKKNDAIKYDLVTCWLLNKPICRQNCLKKTKIVNCVATNNASG